MGVPAEVHNPDQETICGDGRSGHLRIGCEEVRISVEGEPEMLSQNRAGKTALKRDQHLLIVYLRELIEKLWAV